MWFNLAMADKKSPSKSGKGSVKFTAEERAAMKEYAEEKKRQAAGADGEAEVLAKIAEMTPDDRKVAERIHAIVKKRAPGLTPRTWYGMPAYARDGQVVCFFQSAAKFKSRYGTLGFSDKARLDDGGMWPVAFAVKEWSKDVEARIGELVARAA
jgi:uncharacterized protein YdhG (YjbR/CyaY superfamily)